MRSKDAMVVKHLIENKSEELNIRRISKELKMDYKNAYSIVKRLEKNSVIKLEQFGKSSRIKLINQLHPLVFEAECSRRKELLKNKNLGVTLNYFKNALKSRLYILLVFGSYSKKTQTKNSDIDLMFIVPDGREDIFEKDVHQVVKSLPLPIHFLVFSEKQFIEMINSREPNVGQEALKNNIILYGIEPYYGMV